MKARRSEARLDERFNLGIAVNLGIQPSASLSHRCGGKIEKERLAALVSPPQCLVRIANPID
jgi:hypothetical protein